MDDRRFDLLTRTLATTAPRRMFTAMLTASLVAAMPGASGEDGFAKKRKKKKKKKPPATCIPACLSGQVCFNKGCCTPLPKSQACSGGGCGTVSDGCGGTITCDACPAVICNTTTCKNNQCVNTRQPNGKPGTNCPSPQQCCDGACCANGKTCQNNQCIDGCRDEDCFGSRRCRNGVCACPEGLQDCDGQFWCGECCNTAECPGFPNPSGLQCANEEAGSDILVCRCLSGVDCGNGRCVQCCNGDFCVSVYGPGKFCNANGGCACPEGTQQCAKEQGCRDTKTDRFACGPNCVVCGPGRLCENSRCCVGLANPCLFNDDCCGDLACVNIGTVFEPNLVCGTVPVP